MCLTPFKRNKALGKRRWITQHLALTRQCYQQRRALLLSGCGDLHVQSKGKPSDCDTRNTENASLRK